MAIEDIAEVARAENTDARLKRERTRGFRRTALGFGGVILGGTVLYFNADALSLAPDARKVARESLEEILNNIEDSCGIGPKSPVTRESTLADSNALEATARATLDVSTEEQTDCALSILRSLPLERGTECNVAAGYSSGWSEVDGGMRLSVSADCTPTPDQ